MQADRGPLAPPSGPSSVRFGAVYRWWLYYRHNHQSRIGIHSRLGGQRLQALTPERLSVLPPRVACSLSLSQSSACTSRIRSLGTVEGARAIDGLLSDALCPVAEHRTSHHHSSIPSHLPLAL